MPKRNPALLFVGVFPVNARGEILLQLRDDREDLDGPGTWSTLGGVIEPGESPEQAAIRELVEECGQTVTTLVPVTVAERARPDTGMRFTFHIYAAAVDWALDDLILGEGQALAWWPAAEVPSLHLNELIVEDMTAFACSPLVQELARSAPPFRKPSTPPLPPGFTESLGIHAGSLVSLRGATAAFAAHLRAALPAGARLTASPGRDEQPDIELWWPRGHWRDHR
jgi:ADP-ribose pyrophosphatase YjhB (NUDIX family)